jgi:hypothetical protein
LLPKAGYSGKSLPDKLGFKPGMTALFVRLPETLEGLGRSVAFGKAEQRESWAKVSGTGRYDVIHAFTTSRAEVEAALPQLERALKRDGMIWVSWLKKASKVPTDVTEDVLRQIALKGDLVDARWRRSTRSGRV